MSMVLPREARQLGVVPGDRDSVVLFVFGNIFEVWKTDQWVSHLRAVRRDLDAIAEQISEDLG
jgi:UDP-2,3-diacylglucosamine pyrophosphatase LpxH